MTTYNDEDMMAYYLETERGREEWNAQQERDAAYEEFLFRNGEPAELSDREREARRQIEEEYEERIRKNGAPF